MVILMLEGHPPAKVRSVTLALAGSEGTCSSRSNHGRRNGLGERSATLATARQEKQTIMNCHVKKDTL
jgi:hypothetical protein